MLDYGGKKWRCVGNRQYQFIEFINMDEACGRDNEGQAKYNVSLRLVDLNTVTPGNIKSALDCCGVDLEPVPSDEITAECLDSYGCHAPLEQFSGNNAHQLMRQAYSAANALLDPDQLESALAKPVNKIGSTAREFMQGDFTSAIQRGCEAGSTDARIMAKINRIHPLSSRT